MWEGSIRLEIRKYDQKNNIFNDNKAFTGQFRTNFEFDERVILKEWVDKGDLSQNSSFDFIIDSGERGLQNIGITPE